MAEQPLKGMARLQAAWRNSMTGLREVWRSEEAFRIEVIVLALSVPLAFWLGRDAFMTGLLIVSVLLVLIVEVINSAIEAVVDRIGPERHALSGLAKDLGSLAVLLAAFVPGILWLGAIVAKLAG